MKNKYIIKGIFHVYAEIILKNIDKIIIFFGIHLLQLSDRSSRVSHGSVLELSRLNSYFYKKNIVYSDHVSQEKIKL